MSFTHTLRIVVLCFAATILSPAKDDDVGVLHRKGCEQFFEGDFKEAISTWDQEIKLVPKRGPHHWQRGLALYYAGEYDEGVAQFVSHQTVNGSDVENAVWHFLCVARANEGGVEEARRQLIPIQGDTRVPMKEIHQLFAGRAKVAEVLQVAKTRNQLCYAHLYLGLYYEALDERHIAREHLRKAAVDYRMEHYMGLVAQLHYRMIQATRFSEDVALVGDGVVLSGETGKVLVSPRLQGTVLVSTVDGESLGWINREAIASGKGGVGGADRFWFGPDGSQYTVFFEPGAPLEEKNWRVAPEVAEGEMKVLEKANDKVVMERVIRLKNHLGAEFNTRLKRTVTMVSAKSEVTGVTGVAYRVENEITNLGERWNHQKGLLALWSLGSFTGGEKVEVKLQVGAADKVRKYFTPFQKEQLKFEGGVASFRCSGNWRSKIGLAPEDSSGVMVSIDPERRLLTVIRYSVADGERFPHAERGIQKNPYDGDLANVYNHGSLDRKPFDAPQFYEMESASSMRELKKGESIKHWQEVSHYRGDLKKLNELANLFLKMGK